MFILIIYYNCVTFDVFTVGASFLCTIDSVQWGRPVSADLLMYIYEFNEC